VEALTGIKRKQGNVGIGVTSLVMCMVPGKNKQQIHEFLTAELTKPKYQDRDEVKKLKGEWSFCFNGGNHGGIVARRLAETDPQWYWFSGAVLERIPDNFRMIILGVSIVLPSSLLLFLNFSVKMLSLQLTGA